MSTVKLIHLKEERLALQKILNLTSEASVLERAVITERVADLESEIATHPEGLVVYSPSCQRG
jgi:hypothetical protein